MLRKKFLINTSLLGSGWVLLQSSWIAAQAIKRVEDDFIPEGSGLITSPDYHISIDGKEIWTEHFEVSTPKEPDITSRERGFVNRTKQYIGDVQKVAIANYQSINDVSVVIRTKKNVKSCNVRPKSLHIPVNGINTNKLTLKVPANKKLYIDVDDLPPLLLFGDLPEQYSEIIQKADVLYYKKGIHNVGEIKAKSNTTIYLEKDAIVYGRITAEACENLRIIGRGTLDTTKDEEGRAIRLRNCKNILVEGITVRSSKIGWMVVPWSCENVTLNNLKVLGFGSNNDGIDIISSSNIQVKNCFIRSTDDCIALKTLSRDVEMKNIVVEGCTMHGFASSDGFTIGFEIKYPISGVTVKNCDVLSAKGSGTSGGHSALSIVCDGTGPVSDVLFEDIRVEEKLDCKNFELMVTNGKHYSKVAPGAIKNITIRRVHWERKDSPFMIWGEDDVNKVANISFEDCTIANEPLQSAASGNFIINKYTGNISFVHNKVVNKFRNF